MKPLLCYGVKVSAWVWLLSFCVCNICDIYACMWMCACYKMYYAEITTCMNHYMCDVFKLSFWFKCTPSSTQPGFELLTSRSWQYISCHWDACSNHSPISDFTILTVPLFHCTVPRSMKRYLYYFVTLFLRSQCNFYKVIQYPQDHGNFYTVWRYHSEQEHNRMRKNCQYLFV